MVFTVYVEIYLVRHGIAEEPELAASDRARKLTQEGLEKTARVATALRKRLDSLDLILHSPYRRAVETAEIFSSRFPEAELRESRRFTPDDDPEAALGVIEALTGQKRIMIVSHEPYLGLLASYLLMGSTRSPIPFKKAGVAGFYWGGAGGCELLFFTPPRILLA